MNTDRLLPTVDVERLRQAHVVMVGGAYGLMLGLARCGVGSMTLIDFDWVADSNPARQDFYQDDVGRRKVTVVARELRRINPEIDVEPLIRDYCEWTTEQVDQYVGHSDLVIYATDFFPAQARGNIDALRLGIPALWIGLYRSGRAGEIVYHLPGPDSPTPACYRCICGRRYNAFGTGATNVPSAGATIFDLHLVDAIAGEIALGILTRGADNRMGRLIDQLGNRNFLQVKIDPEYRLGEKDLFGQYLGHHPANFSFSTIALPMEVDPNCADCRSYPRRVAQSRESQAA